VKTGSRCDGRCCVVFSLSGVQPSDMEGPDGATVRDMLVQLSPGEFRLRSWRFGIFPAVEESGEGFYRCRHWDERTRLCRIYARRPRTCRKWPYGRACPYCGEADAERSRKAVRMP
jgi:Fe-S-cluster containining protein